MMKATGGLSLRVTTLRLTFFVGRNGHRLRLFNMEGEVVAIYDNVGELTTMLGNAIGRRLMASA